MDLGDPSHSCRSLTPIDSSPKPIAAQTQNLSMTRRSLFQTIRYLATALFPRFSKRDPSESVLFELEQHVQKAVARLNGNIERQNVIERSLRQRPTDQQLRDDLDLIECEINVVHDEIALLIEKLIVTPALTLSGLQVKARLEPYGDGISQSICRDLLAISELDVHSGQHDESCNLPQ
jgi:hypothetical protein